MLHNVVSEKVFQFQFMVSLLRRKKRKEREKETERVGSTRIVKSLSKSSPTWTSVFCTFKLVYVEVVEFNSHPTSDLSTNFFSPVKVYSLDIHTRTLIHTMHHFSMANNKKTHQFSIAKHAVYSFLLLY